jgi:alpha-tubulin suppressor-like RCC1 family protein
VCASRDFSLGIKGDGTLWAWGSNYYGQLGDSTNIDSLIPLEVGADKNWSTVNASYHHVMAIGTDGATWAWGANWEGQLGNGTFADLNSPSRVHF